MRIPRSWTRRIKLYPNTPVSNLPAGQMCRWILGRFVVTPGVVQRGKLFPALLFLNRLAGGIRVQVFALLLYRRLREFGNLVSQFLELTLVQKCPDLLHVPIAQRFVEENDLPVVQLRSRWKELSGFFVLGNVLFPSQIGHGTAFNTESSMRKITINYY
jgi:hypothetical protein